MLRVTPAMAIGLDDHARELEELVGLLDAKELVPVGTDSNKRGPYKKKAKDSD